MEKSALPFTGNGQQIVRIKGKDSDPSRSLEEVRAFLKSKEIRDILGEGKPGVGQVLENIGGAVTLQYYNNNNILQSIEEATQKEGSSVECFM